MRLNGSAIASVRARIDELRRVGACTRYCADVVPQVADGSRTILADSWTADSREIIAAKRCRTARDYRLRAIKANLSLDGLCRIEYRL